MIKETQAPEIQDDVFEQWLEKNPHFKMYNNDAAHRAFESQKQPTSLVDEFVKNREKIKTGQENTDALIAAGKKTPGTDNLVTEQTNSAPKSNTKKQQFAKVDARISMNMKTSKCHHNSTGLLIILLKHRSWNSKKDKHETWDYWYQIEKKIVASVGYEKLMSELGVSYSNIRRYLNKLEDNGDIKRELEGRENVFVLGEVDEDGNEILYYTQPKKT